jgi:hypothetical protein
MPLDNNIFTKLFEIGEKLTSFARFLIPGVALFYLLKIVFKGFWEFVTEWFDGLILDLLTKVKDAMLNLGVDLTPSAEFQAFIAKANSVVPLDEAWRLILVYLAFASVVMGVKWTRNLIPGMS